VVVVVCGGRRWAFLYGKEFLIVNIFDTGNTAWVLLFEHAIIGL